MSEPISEVNGRLKNRQAAGFWEVEGHGILEYCHDPIYFASSMPWFKKDGKRYDLLIHKFQDLWKQGKAKKL